MIAVWEHWALCDARRVSITIPAVLVGNVTQAWGDDGERWLGRLPALLDGVARDWGLPPVSRSSVA